MHLEQDYWVADDKKDFDLFDIVAIKEHKSGVMLITIVNSFMHFRDMRQVYTALKDVPRNRNCRK